VVDFEPATISMTSSAYFDISLPGVIGLRSFTHTINAAGPIADPCTTEVLIGRSVDVISSNRVLLTLKIICEPLVNIVWYW